MAILYRVGNIWRQFETELEALPIVTTGIARTVSQLERLASREVPYQPESASSVN